MVITMFLFLVGLQPPLFPLSLLNSLRTSHPSLSAAKSQHTDFVTVTNQLSTKTLKYFLHTGILPTALDSTYTTIYTPDMKVSEILDPYAVEFGGDI